MSTLALATRADFEALGQNLLAEFIGGHIVMSPGPTLGHQTFLRRLVNVLDAACPRGYRAEQTWNYRAGADDFIPDGMVFSVDQVTTDVRFEGTPELIIEVLSTNRAADLVIKAQKYAAAGVSRFWIADLVTQTLTLFRVDGHSYAMEAVLTRGDLVLVEFCPGGSAQLNLDHLLS